jgi:hypothetical protein
MKTALCFIAITSGLMTVLHAVVPEPDYVVYGLVYAGTNQLSQLTAANTNVVIEARRTPTGPALASYTMGAKAAYGDYYSVRLSLESVLPLAGPQSFQTGDTFYLTLTDAGNLRAQMPLVVGARGQIARSDFMSGNYPADWLARLKHPADNAPADNSISASELDAYATAWKQGGTWPTDPNPIPIAYVARAGALLLAGGNYVFDPSKVSSAPPNTPSWWATNAPLWWTVTVPAPAVPGGNSVTRTVPATYQPGVPLTVTAAVRCGNIGAYAVEDQPPSGWQVSNISDGGVFDRVNQKVKWGLFLDNTPRNLTYSLTPPANASGDATFSGLGAFDGQPIAVAGQNETGPPAVVGGTQLTLSHAPGSAFKIHLKGDPGGTQVVDVSTNLVNWLPWTNIVLDANGLGQLTDPGATNQGWRFYRSTESQ